LASQASEERMTETHRIMLRLNCLGEVIVSLLMSEVEIDCETA